MPVKRIPSRRTGMIREPARVEVSLDQPLNPNGSRQTTSEEHAALRKIFDGLARQPYTFAGLTAPTEQFCRRIIERHGGIASNDMPAEWLAGPTTHHAGYAIRGHVKDASELWYALEILWALIFAQSPDRDEALRSAWMAGGLVTEAALRFRWEQDALLGESHRGKQRARARAGAETRRDEAARENEGLLTKVRALRAKHPTYTKRALAALMVSADAPERQKAIDATRKQIERLERKK